MVTLDSRLTRAIMACLFAALISIGAYIAIPIPGTPVPIVLQNMFIIMAGFVLGPWWGLAAVLLYLMLGAIGLPVFSGGTGGLVRFAGPTGGYLIGYIPAIIVFGLASKFKRQKWYLNAVAGLVGMAIVYALGVAWLKLSLAINWTKALATGALPFIPGDVAKIAIASALAPQVSKVLRHIEETSTDV